MTTTGEYRHLIYQSLFELADDFYDEAAYGNTGAERIWFLDQSVALHKLAELVRDGDCNILSGQAYVEAGRSLHVRIKTTRVTRGKNKSSTDRPVGEKSPRSAQHRCAVLDAFGYECTCGRIEFEQRVLSPLEASKSILANREAFHAHCDQARMDEVHASRASRR